MSYGLPYVGSKNKIVPFIIDHLPAGEVFVDLFAGGCSVTHGAMLSGKYKRFIINDIGDGPEIFVNAINGKYKDYSFVPDRKQFFETDDPVAKMCYSFANNQITYLWGSELEPVKVHASRMLVAPTVKERRAEYREFIKALSEYMESGDAPAPEKLRKVQSMEGIRSVERIQHLNNAERVPDVELLQRDYQDVEIPRGAVVYCDPPYRGTLDKRYYIHGFDFDRFDDWLASVDFPVYVSEYTQPRGCVEIARIKKRKALAPSGKSSLTVERLFVQERYADV